MGLQEGGAAFAVFQVVWPQFALLGHALGNALGLGGLGGLRLPLVVGSAQAPQGLAAGLLHGCATPSGVDDAQILALQRHGQVAQKVHDGAALGRVVRAGKTGVFAQIALQAGIKKPARTIFGVVAQQIDLVVARNGHGFAAGDQLVDDADHPRAVRAAIDKIAQEHQSAAFWVIASRVIAEVAQ